MATHSSLSALLKESIPEYLAIAEYCIYSRKDAEEFGNSGCYGYPAALLLLTIVDTIGSYVLDGNTENHFRILKHKDYYNLNLTKDELNIVYMKHRCLLAHNAALSYNSGLSIGEINSQIFEWRDQTLYLNLIPFLELSKKVTRYFLAHLDTLVADSNRERKVLDE